MTTTKNKYTYPVDSRNIIKIFYKKSPAHSEKYKNGRYKFAVDFCCLEGTPIKDAADGKVIEIKSDSDIGGTDEKFDVYGNYIEIEHTNNEYSEYEHLKKDGSVVNVGDEVKEGQIIGYSGATGWIANLGPHLHFMVGKYGKTVEEYQTFKIIWRKHKK